MLLDVEETRRRSGYGRSRSRRPKRGDPEAAAQLTRMVEAEIIPRLMLAHGTRAGRRAPDPPGPHEVVAVADIAVHGGVRDLSRYVDAVRDRGIPLDAVLLDLLAPAARLLGERWLSDEASFADVTIGLTHLHRLLHELVDLIDDLAPAPRARRALLMPAEGEQHTFGLLMVEVFLRHAGWEVWPGPADAAKAATLVGQRRFDMVGVSASSETRLDSIAALIGALRRASRNAEVAVLVGGPLFVAHPEHATTVGADASARDAREACRVAGRLVAKPLDPRRKSLTTVRA